MFFCSHFLLFSLNIATTNARALTMKHISYFLAGLFDMMYGSLKKLNEEYL